MDAQVIEILVMLVVSQADNVGTQLFDQRHILLVVSFADRSALVQPILVAADAVQRDVLAVEIETGIGINMGELNTTLLSLILTILHFTHKFYRINQLDFIRPVF